MLVSLMVDIHILIFQQKISLMPLNSLLLIFGYLV